MKAMLYAAVEQAPSAELVDPDVLSRYFAKFDEQFFHYCDKELAKINTFYSEKMAEATRKYGNLRSELTETLEMGHVKKQSAWKSKTPLGRKEYLKKHDKLLSVDFGATWRKEHVEAAHFYTNKDIDRLIHETETAFTHEIEGRRSPKAMKRLRVPPLGEQQSPWTTFK
ncbi:Xenotropic and polytropic retrovirus receptor 1 homolog, partial [Eumeta japonica]